MLISPCDELYVESCACVSCVSAPSAKWMWPWRPSKRLKALRLRQRTSRATKTRVPLSSLHWNNLRKWWRVGDWVLLSGKIKESHGQILLLFKKRKTRWKCPLKSQYHRGCEVNSKLGSSDIKALALTLSSISAYSVRLAQQWLPGAWFLNQYANASNQ